MKRKQPRSKTPPEQIAEPAKARDDSSGRIIERPDGFYWQSPDGGSEYGPFPTLAEAELDLQAVQAGGESLEAGSLYEAESELGISEWIDPDTGGPAEDSVPRIEDH